jgi:four helix bundle protein
MVDSYKKLDVWQRSIRFVKEIYNVSDDFPKKEQYRLTDQICRAVVSIAANIAEGSARKSNKEFMRFLAMSLGSLAEVRTHAIIACTLEYISTDTLSGIESECDVMGKQLQALYNSMERKLDHA